MKKGLVLAFLLLSPFLLTACGDKEESGNSSSKTKMLTCKADVSGLDTTIKLEYNTKKKEINSAVATYVMDLSGYSELQIEALKKSDLCTSFNQELANSCNSTYSDKDVTIVVDMNISYMVEKEFAGDKNYPLEEIKAGYEKNLNAECTIN